MYIDWVILGRQEVVDVQLAVLDFALLGTVCGRPRCACSVVFSLSSNSVTAVAFLFARRLPVDEPLDGNPPSCGGAGNS